MGIYSGNYPWPDLTGYTGEPRVPKMTSFNIESAVVAPNEKVKFNASAETRN